MLIKKNEMVGAVFAATLILCLQSISLMSILLLAPVLLLMKLGSSEKREMDRTWNIGVNSKKCYVPERER